jgi:cation diffusion facilitator family transporter
MTSFRAEDRDARLGMRIALASILTNAVLCVANVAGGLHAGSTSVVAAGVEFGADVFAALLVYAGLRIASRPADYNHPYGHGRAEGVAGLVVGVLLVITGIGIAVKSLQQFGASHPPPSLHGLWPLMGALAVKAILLAVKLRVGKRIRSASLVADGWNDTVDLLSGGAALTALGLTLYDPSRFLAADHFGGFAVGLVVISIGLRVSRDTSLELMDTMPPGAVTDRVRRSASGIPGVRGTEKCFARKTGLRYHVDLHIEVDPHLTVADSHEIAQAVRDRIRQELSEVADVLVHVEPSQAPPSPNA